jgi:hypothetical protein
MPRALTNCGSVCWYSELRVDSAAIHAIPSITSAAATSAVTCTRA